MGLIYKWKCCECGDIHDDDYDAMHCCPPNIQEVTLCPICRKSHMFDHDAYACCEYEDGQDIPPHPLDLEEAGQGRLLP